MQNTSMPRTDCKAESSCRNGCSQANLKFPCSSKLDILKSRGSVVLSVNSQVPHLVSSDPPDRLSIVGYVEPFLEILSFIECWDKNRIRMVWSSDRQTLPWDYFPLARHTPQNPG